MHYLLPVEAVVDTDTGEVVEVNAATDRMIPNPILGAVMDENGRAIGNNGLAARARAIAEEGEWPSWP